MQEPKLEQTKTVNDSWLPTRKSQAHKHIILHYFLENSTHPLCDHNRTACPLAPNRITAHCAECKALFSSLSKGILRKCKVCGLEAHNEKDLEQFRPDKTMLFQRGNLCLKCFHELGQNYHEINKETINARHRERRKQLPKGYAKKWSLKQPKQHNAARAMARRNVPINQPCSQCGSKENLARHHPDYSKPKDVIILCRKCHAAAHSKYLHPSGERHLVDQ